MVLPNLTYYIANAFGTIPALADYDAPWAAIDTLAEIIRSIIPTLSPEDYHVKDTIAIHKTALIESGVTIKAYTIIEEGTIVKSGAYLRDGVYLARNVSIGANCELKQSIIFDSSRIAHLNYVGNSLIGADVNLEAGAVLANHFNERTNKEIEVLIEGKRYLTNTIKFGSLLGDGCRIGANAVLNPGTILNKGTIVNRLTHVDQLKK